MAPAHEMIWIVTTLHSSRWTLDFLKVCELVILRVQNLTMICGFINQLIPHNYRQVLRFRVRACFGLGILLILISWFCHRWIYWTRVRSPSAWKCKEHACSFCARLSFHTRIIWQATQGNNFAGLSGRAATRWLSRQISASLPPVSCRFYAPRTESIWLIWFFTWKQCCPGLFWWSVSVPQVNWVNSVNSD